MSLICQPDIRGHEAPPSMLMLGERRRHSLPAGTKPRASRLSSPEERQYRRAQSQGHHDFHRPGGKQYQRSQSQGHHNLYRPERINTSGHKAKGITTFIVLIESIPVGTKPRASQLRSSKGNTIPAVTKPGASQLRSSGGETIPVGTKPGASQLRSSGGETIRVGTNPMTSQLLSCRRETITVGTKPGASQISSPGGEAIPRVQSQGNHISDRPEERQCQRAQSRRHHTTDRLEKSDAQGICRRSFFAGCKLCSQTVCGTVSKATLETFSNNNNNKKAERIWASRTPTYYFELNWFCQDWSV